MTKVKGRALSVQEVSQILRSLQASGHLTANMENLSSEQLDNLLGMIEVAFLRRDYVPRGPAFYEARIGHVLRMRNLALKLRAALAHVYVGSHFAYWREFRAESARLSSDLSSEKSLDLPETLRIEEALDELISESNDLLVRFEKSARKDVQPTSWGTTGNTALFRSLEDVYRRFVVCDADWKPKLQNSKRSGVDVFTAFVLAILAAKGEPIDATTFQRLYRRSIDEQTSIADKF